jgi:IS1 family transposase
MLPYMNKLTTAERVTVVAALCEGNSMRSVARMTSIARNTIAKLFVDLGAACSEYQDRTLRGLPCKRIQVDEICSFVYAKATSVRTAKAAPLEAGAVWTFTAIDADTKLAPSWLVGPRDQGTAAEFMRDVAARMANRVQLTTDGLNAYLWVSGEFSDDMLDFAPLHKIYAATLAGEGRYGPPKCNCTRTRVVRGDPDPAHISTSYVERANLSVRMSMRRFTKLTNAFSKKLENHCAAISLYVMHYNFARIHQMLRVTPAMAAGVADHAWEIDEIVALLDAREALPDSRPARIQTEPLPRELT